MIRQIIKFYIVLIALFYTFQSFELYGQQDCIRVHYSYSENGANRSVRLPNCQYIDRDDLDFSGFIDENERVYAQERRRFVDNFHQSCNFNRPATRQWVADIDNDGFFVAFETSQNQCYFSDDPSSVFFHEACPTASAAACRREQNQNVNDCDDFNDLINPAQQEICYDPDDWDEDCSGDFDDPIPPETCDVNNGADLDRDGFCVGVVLLDDNGEEVLDEEGNQILTCDNPDQVQVGDCNDNPSTRGEDQNPSLAEICGDGLDNDCNGRRDQEDEACYASNGLDDDGDGYCEATEEEGCLDGSLPGDCNDDPQRRRNNNEEVIIGTLSAPSLNEICGDDIDNDCDASTPDDCESVEEDLDNDGYCASESCNDITLKPNDCDDNNPQINPGIHENCENLIDDNCNLAIDIQESSCVGSPKNDDDGDGYCESKEFCNDGSKPGDCNDNVNENGFVMSPGRFETCDSIDNDCDGLIDDGLGTSDTSDSAGGEIACNTADSFSARAASSSACGCDFNSKPHSKKQLILVFLLASLFITWVTFLRRRHV